MASTPPALGGGSSLAMVNVLMEQFVDRTMRGESRHRYLWTDSFAVCNLLGLYRRTNHPKYLADATCMVDHVHSVLGMHRPDDSRKRTGWISGLSENEGKQHPTRGGLRIGKPRNERLSTEPPDDRLEWEQDGQYFHYLTKWMHALDLMARISGDDKYKRWALELAQSAHASFVYSVAPGLKRMHWKMSIDLSRPLVASMGHHDPVDGLVSLLQLSSGGNTVLSDEVRDMAGIVYAQIGSSTKGLVTTDALGIGGLLSDACRLLQVMIEDALASVPLTLDAGHLLASILRDAQRSFEGSSRVHQSLSLPADARLAFRELGLSIGMHAVEKMRDLIAIHPEFMFAERAAVESTLESLEHHQYLAHLIEDFWMQAHNRETNAWIEHQNINCVMLSTSLSSDGFLALPPRRCTGGDSKGD